MVATLGDMMAMDLQWSGFASSEAWESQATLQAS